MLDYRILKSDRQWKATTGLNPTDFEKLCFEFGKTYEKQQGISLSKLLTNHNQETLLKSYQDCLFFVLFQLKNNLSYDTLGFLLGTDHSNAMRNFEKYLSLLQHTLESLGMMPKRSFADVKEFEQYLQKEESIIMDASEQATFRAKDNDIQKQHYSGKKSVIHTKK